MASFGIEDFAKKYGELRPSQFVDIISLVGDKADNIPGFFGVIYWTFIRTVSFFRQIFVGFYEHLEYFLGVCTEHQTLYHW